MYGHRKYLFQSDVHGTCNVFYIRAFRSFTYMAQSAATDHQGPILPLIFVRHRSLLAVFSRYF